MNAVKFALGEEPRKSDPSVAAADRG